MPEISTIMTAARRSTLRATSGRKCQGESKRTSRIGVESPMSWTRTQIDRASPARKPHQAVL